MARLIVNGILLAVLGVLVVLILVFRRDFTQRNSEFLPGMVTSVPYDAQSPNPNFADGRTLRTPQPGTVARDFPPLEVGPNPQGALRASRELINPLPDTVESVYERGAVVYATFCQPCHGVGGKGDGIITQRGFPPPPSLFVENALRMKDGQMFHIVTFGQGNMPALAGHVPREDRWSAIKHIRRLQQQSVAAGRP